MTRLDLRAYQRADVAIGVQKRRFMHTGDPGLGKTGIATRVIEEALITRPGRGHPSTHPIQQRGAFPCLVQCPGYLVDQWNDHLIAEGHGGDILVAATVATRGGKIQALSPAEKRELLERAKDERVNWVIVNHEMMRQPPKQSEKSVTQIWRETAQEKGWTWGKYGLNPPKPRRAVSRYDVHKVGFTGHIIDEAHRLRNAKSQQFRGAYSVANRDRCQVVIELTATPIYRDVGDLYAQLRILDGRRFMSYSAFITAHAIVEHDDWGDHIVGARPSAKKLLAEYAIHRGYGDPEVRVEIPALIPRTIRCTLSTTGHTQYKQLKKSLQGTGQYLPSLRHQTATDPVKLKALDDLLTDVGDLGYIIFTYYRETAKMLSKRLGVPVALGGQKGNPQLAKSVGPSGTSATNGMNPTAPGLVATIDCLQEGVDLSHLRVVVFYEDDYLPGKREQAMKRVQRWRPDGSADPVLVYWMIARDTIDERVHDVANGRGAAMEQIVRMEEAA